MKNEIMAEKMRGYLGKYGKVEGWNLALKFQVLFDVIRTLSGKDTMNSSLAGEIYKVVYSLSETENSGVVSGATEFKERDWEDSCKTSYQCGKSILEFECYTTYRKGLDEDWYLTVKVCNG